MKNVSKLVEYILSNTYLVSSTGLYHGKAVPSGSIAGFSASTLAKYYGSSSSSPVSQTGHMIVVTGTDKNNDYTMYDPSHDKTFTMSKEDYAKATFNW